MSEPRGRGILREPRDRGILREPRDRGILREPRGRGILREPKSRGADWTDERGTSKEGRRRLESGPEASGRAERAGRQST